MEINIQSTPAELGRIAGAAAAGSIRRAIADNGTANIILATGASQFATLQQLISEEGIDWGKVVMFHLDEYIGLPITHAASFRRYLQERFLNQLPPLKEAWLINGETDPEVECERLGKLISRYAIDVALVGIGENGHLAFNDPPADFETDQPYIIVVLDERCRRQQLGEGWFDTLSEVPAKAVSMSIKQIMKSKHLVCSVPDQRKAAAVKNTVERLPNNLFPASILQLHSRCSLYLDKASASALTAYRRYYV